MSDRFYPKPERIDTLHAGPDRDDLRVIAQDAQTASTQLHREYRAGHVGEEELVEACAAYRQQIVDVLAALTLEYEAVSA